MTAQDNIEATEKAYAAFAAADVDAASEKLADDIEWIVPGNSAISGTYRGKDDVTGFWMALAGKGFRTVPEHILGDDERVVVLARTEVEGEEPSEAVDVLTFVDGVVTKFQTANDTALQERIWGSK